MRDVAGGTSRRGASASCTRRPPAATTRRLPPLTPPSAAVHRCAVYNKLTGRTGRDPNPEFCVVVRTYWGHGQTAGDGGLRRLLRSLQRQSVQS